MNQNIPEPKISFYLLDEKFMLKTICQILTKCYQSGNKSLVLVKDDDFITLLDKSLWSFSSTSFVPHTQNNDLKSEISPIHLTTSFKNPNSATILVDINSKYSYQEELFTFKKALFMLSAQDSIALQEMRLKYKQLKKLGYSIECFQQNEELQWVTKISA